MKQQDHKYDFYHDHDAGKNETAEHEAYDQGNKRNGNRKDHVGL